MPLAVIVTAVWLSTCKVLTVNGALVCPARIVIGVCGFAADLLDNRVTEMLYGAAHDSVTVPVVWLPPVTGFGLKVTVVIGTGVNFNLPITVVVVPTTFAETLTTLIALTLLVVTPKVFCVSP